MGQSNAILRPLPSGLEQGHVSSFSLPITNAVRISFNGVIRREKKRYKGKRKRLRETETEREEKSYWLLLG